MLPRGLHAVRANPDKCQSCCFLWNHGSHNYMMARFVCLKLRWLSWVWLFKTNYVLAAHQRLPDQQFHGLARISRHLTHTGLYSSVSYCVTLIIDLLCGIVVVKSTIKSLKRSRKGLIEYCLPTITFNFNFYYRIHRGIVSPQSCISDHFRQYDTILFFLECFSFFCLFCSSTRLMYDSVSFDFDNFEVEYS